MSMTKLQKIRQAFADYVASEGCSCCQNIEAHTEAAAKLGKLLHVDPYEDGSGYDFRRYRTRPVPQHNPQLPEKP